MTSSEKPAQDSNVPPDADRLFVALSPLLARAPKAPDVATVAAALGVDLVVLRDLQADGKTYGGDNRGTGWAVEYFTNPSGRFNLDVTLGRGSDATMPPAGIDNWQALLIRSGWKKMPSITHPVRLETFVKEAWECRLEHDGIRVSHVVLLNL